MATRSQTETQIKWSTADTNAVAADGAMDWSDDFTFSGDMIDAQVTVEGNSAGTFSDDIIEVHVGRKKDPDNSNSGTPDTYDSEYYTYIGRIDCSSGNDTQRTFKLPMMMAGDIVRFGAKTDGTSIITVGMRVTEDKVAL